MTRIRLKVRRGTRQTSRWEQRERDSEKFMQLIMSAVGPFREALRVALRSGLMATCLGVFASLAGCAQPERVASRNWPPSTYMFPPSKVEVPASPRVATGRNVPRGGGVYKVGNPYKVAGKWYVPRHESGYDKTGLGSWYGDDFHGRKTANGEIFDKYALTAAHPTLPLPSYAYVTNLDNGRTVLVRINDRGPYSGGRIIDLSHQVARHLDFERKGLTRVRVRYAGRAPLNGDDRREQQFLAEQPWARGQRFAGPSDYMTTGALRR